MLAPNLPAGYLSVLATRRAAVAEQLATALGTSNAPIVWEVGCGHGHFLTAYATAHPGRLCIGVDIESDRIARAEKKRMRAKLKNVHFIRSEGRLFLQALPTGTKISDVFILFPDPWPKARHHKHRLLQLEFLRQLAGHATTEARLYFRTDHREYFEQARTVLTQSDDWELIDAPWAFEHPTVFQSRAEAHASLIARKRSTKS